MGSKNQEWRKVHHPQQLLLMVATTHSMAFRKRIYYESVGSGSPGKTSGSPGSTPLLSPAKKRRSGFVQGCQPSRCQMEGCKVDLSDAKAYYSRHNVCGMHSKSGKVTVAGLQQSFASSAADSMNCLNLTKQSEVAADALLDTMIVRESQVRDLCCLLLAMAIFSLHVRTFPSSPSGRNPSPNSAYERGLETNQAAIAGKLQLPLQSNSQSPPPDLLTNIPSNCVSSQECFNGVSGSNKSLPLLSNQPSWSISRICLEVNNDFLDRPSDTSSGATIDQFVCCGFKGNTDNGTLHEMLPHLGLGQASNGQYNEGLGLAHPSGGQFHEMDQFEGI